MKVILRPLDGKNTKVELPPDQMDGDHPKNVITIDGKTYARVQGPTLRGVPLYKEA